MSPSMVQKSYSNLGGKSCSDGSRRRQQLGAHSIPLSKNPSNSNSRNSSNSNLLNSHSTSNSKPQSSNNLLSHPISGAEKFIQPKSKSTSQNSSNQYLALNQSHLSSNPQVNFETLPPNVSSVIQHPDGSVEYKMHPTNPTSHQVGYMKRNSDYNLNTRTHLQYQENFNQPNLSMTRSMINPVTTQIISYPSGVKTAHARSRSNPVELQPWNQIQEHIPDDLEIEQAYQEVRKNR